MNEQSKTADRTLRGREFFSRPISRSVLFAVLSLILLIVICFDASLLIGHWGRLPSRIGFPLFVFGVGGVVAQWFRALSCHARLYELYLVGKLQECETDGPLNVALEAAATMSLDALFFSFTTAFILLGIIYNLLRNVQA